MGRSFNDRYVKSSPFKDAIIGKNPKAPDPYATADAQGKMNLDFATKNAELNRINQKNPYGELSYSQTGTNPDGTPIYTQTTTLSPELQHQFDAQNSGTSAYLDQINKSAGTQLTPDANDLATTRDAYYNQQKAFLDPQWDRQQKDLQTQLANSGVAQNSEAYNNAMDALNRQKTFAYNDAQNNAIVQGGKEQSRLFGLGADAKTLPVNILNAIRSGNQVPSFQGFQSTAAGTPDLEGLIGNNYKIQAANYSNNLQGLFSLVGSAMKMGG